MAREAGYVKELLDDHIEDGTAIDIGNEHFITFYSYKDVPKAGCIVYHKNPEGVWCMGSVSFKLEGVDHAYAKWDVIDFDPLWIEPSVLCRAPLRWSDGVPVGECLDHGFIRQGVWVPA